MNKAIGTLIAAVAAAALSSGVYAQTAGGSSGSTGSTASPANQVNGATGGYGTPGTTHSGSGMAAKPNSGLPSSTNSTTKSDAPAPKSNNTLATPSVVSPAAGQ
ncbi:MULTISPECIES: hypothetical protein [unclassified Caballeronia]|jgi:hypothetical protein|uniref:hypothetical protein n=1 Tax=unclassified Caballeronia TaxID=2646786 RepID=UPI00202931B1|nr:MULTISPECIES: hypothetical protein [unclassified Caballeronia]MDR5769602.1 hypothetical protein [Caballeronia sp. LZ028]